ncbi:3D domain-containing protein [Ornithinibacillus sp. FSL M8-0202]|uniref:PcsB-like coiled-coil domain-containing protein n=1 Tax=Ornithinibacillus sp. FSL M8-0202 TaxID=2921616 RepID=UPI0030D2767F
MRKLTVITLAITIIFGISFSTHVLADDKKDDLQEIKKQREQIQENLSGAEKQISTIMSEIDNLNKEISDVEEEISKKQLVIDETEDKLHNTVDEIAQLQKEIQELDENIAKRHKLLEDRISSYQKSGGHISYLEVLFGAQSFSDFISRITMVNTITKSDSDLIAQLEADMKAVEEKQLLSLNKLDHLNELKLEQEKALAEVQEQKQQNEQRKNSLESKQTELLAKIENLKSEDNSLASMESKVREQIAAAKAKAEAEAKAKAEAEAAAKAEEEAKKESAEREQKNSDKDTNEDTLNQVSEKTLTVTATAYTADCKGCSGTTHTGIDLIANPDTKVIAVDPSVIPLGSVVYVEGYGYAIAGDIGSAIKGNKIDVFVPTRAEALKWGVRRVKVTIQ